MQNLSAAAIAERNRSNYPDIEEGNFEDDMGFMDDLDPEGFEEEDDVDDDDHRRGLWFIANQN